MAKTGRQRTPKLRFSARRGIGRHVSYRAPVIRTPRKHRSNIRERQREAEAGVPYHVWEPEHLGGQNSERHPTRAGSAPNAARPNVRSGSLLEIARRLIESEHLRARTDDGPRRPGTIAAAGFRDRKKQIRDLLDFLNEQNGADDVAQLRIADLTMEDVETPSAARCQNADSSGDSQPLAC